MRKALIAALLAAVVAPVAAQAQTAELRHDRREIRQEQRDLQRAYRHGDRRDVREAQRDLRDARREYRDDWQDYRRRNPGLYRGPAYVGPRGWRYAPIATGYRFRPDFYAQRYWVDPYRYHLRPLGPRERWIRYGRDVVRVDLRTGRALEIHGGFFF
jgi:hypothetical protein